MERKFWVDCAKGWGILLVVLGHSHGPDWICNIIFLFHMPVFFFLSGYLFNYPKYKDDFRQYLQKKTERLIIPYGFSYVIVLIIWALIFLTLLLFHISYQNEVFTLNPTDIVVSLLYGNGAETGPTITHTTPYLAYPMTVLDIPLWFLPSLFCSLLLMYGVLRLTKRYGVFSGVFCTFLLVSIGILCGMYFYLPWSLDIGCIALLFVGAGYLFRWGGIDEKIKKAHPVFTGCFLVLLFCYFFNVPIDMNNRVYQNVFLFVLGGIAGSLLIFYLCIVTGLYPKLTSLMTFLGGISLFIMVFHIPFYEIPVQLIQIVNVPFSDYLMNTWYIRFPLSLSICLVIAYFFKKNSIFRDIFLKS
jgi:acyltransferase